MSPFFSYQFLYCAAVETSFQLLRKFFFCVYIDTDLLKSTRLLAINKMEYIVVAE